MLGRFPEGGNGNQFQDSCWGNSMDRRAWGATVHGVAEADRTEQLTSGHTVLSFNFFFLLLTATTTFQ